MAVQAGSAGTSAASREHAPRRLGAPSLGFAELLEGAAAVSFDFFDTLVERKGLFSPKDLFYDVQQEGARRLERRLDDFPGLRIRAEEIARARAWGHGHEEVTLAEIYADVALLAELTEDEADELGRIELETEREAVAARDAGRSLYEQAVAAGKPVVVISDTYLDADFVAELARRAGYSHLGRCYTSSSHRKSKLYGSLFDVVLEDVGCLPGELLHVGDDPVSDVTPALGKGLRVFHVPTTTQRWRRRNGVPNRPSGSRVMSALLERASETTTVADADDRQAVLASVAERSLSVLFFGFAAWLVERIRRDGHRRVFFAARDGLVIKRFFDHVASAVSLDVESRYLSVSRASLYPSLIATNPPAARRVFSRAWDRLSVDAALARLSLTREDCGADLQRHRLDEPDLALTASTAERLLALLEEIWPLVEERNRERLDLIVAYLSQEGVLTSDAAAFVDIGWHGSSQDCLLRLCSHLGIQKQFDGYYVGTFERPIRPPAGFRASGFLVEDNVPRSRATVLRSSPSLLELLHSAAHGCVVGYGHDGETVVPVLEDSPWERRQYRDVIQPIQDRAFELVAGLVASCGSAPIGAPDPDVVARAALRVLDDPTPGEAAVLGGLRIVTDVGGPAKSITGAVEFHVEEIDGERLPDGTHPMWPAGLHALRRSGETVWTGDRPLITVVIAARNAGETLAATLQSLSAQTFDAWEALVVDDGSTDNTAAVASSFAVRDSRIRVVTQPQRGVSAARNDGYTKAQSEWLMFLDADDWLTPQHLERMAEATVKGNAGVLHCGWARVAPGGGAGDEKRLLESGDLFHVLGRFSPFAIHACMVRRSLVEAAGGFDDTLRTCEDWDLWQRLARRGTTFQPVPELTAQYRMRSDSAIVDADEFLSGALRVVSQGYDRDFRVQDARPEHAAGLPRRELPARKLLMTTWAAGLVIGRGEAAGRLLRRVGDASDPGLRPDEVADALFDSIPIPTCRLPSDWPALWEEVSARLTEFLRALESQSRAAGLARRTLRILERRVLQRTTDLPRSVGATHGVCLELTRPLADVAVDSNVERLHCTGELEGRRLGAVELPVEGMVPSGVLADAIVTELAWPIVVRFLTATTGRARTPDDDDWLVFLRELWGCPSWPLERFYDAAWKGEDSELVRADGGVVSLEVSADLPDIALDDDVLRVEVTVGGARIGVVTVPVSDERKIATAHAIRVAITTATGLELARAAAREGILGQPLGGASLKERLRTATTRAAWYSELSPSLTLERRSPAAFGTSASRRAVLPRGAADALADAAALAGEACRAFPTHGPVLYVPELVDPSTVRLETSAGTVDSQSPAADAGYGRAYFDALFAERPDPWEYTSPYEETKHEHTLSLVPASVETALELACAEGHFTARLARRARSVLAADISEIALDRARERCSMLDNVEFVRLDLFEDPIPDRFDLVVCSEVLYFAGECSRLDAAAAKVAEALKPGGHIVTAHANLVVDDPDSPGYDWDLPFGAKAIGEAFASAGLALVKELRMPLYRVQLFRSHDDRDAGPPEIVELPQPTPPPPRAADTVRWHGASRTPAPVTTAALPILVYHRISPHGPPAGRPYRVTPEAFEEQLRWLRLAGFRSASLAEWRRAVHRHEPLPGRAVLITFDDGYRDFVEHAWPLLEKYGFKAVVFLVAGEVGSSNRRDAALGEEVPLLDWHDARRLRSGGIELGSHGVSHRPLAALTPEEVVREAAGSRAIMTRELGVPPAAFAYPCGDADPAVQHLVGACGYTYGLTTRGGRARLSDDLLALPRIEITGLDSLTDVVAKLEAADGNR